MTPWTAAGQASLSITNSQSLLRVVSIDSVMPSNPLILCLPLLLLPSVFPSIRVFLMSQFFASGWAKYWSFSFSISPSNEYSGLISFRTDWFDLLQSKGLSGVFSSTAVQKHQFNLLNVSHATDTDLVSNIFKQLIRLNRRQAIRSESGQKSHTDLSPKKTYKWLTGT